MVKKIKFPLEMGNGVMVRTLEELKDNFSIEKVISHFVSGKLLTWLNDRYYEDEAIQVGELNGVSKDFEKRLCEILECEYTEDKEIDMEAIERRNIKLSKLKQITEDDEVLKNVDRVAFDQEELADLLDENVTTIYLCGEKFTIPFKENITYIGINDPIIVKSKLVELNELNEKNIVITGVKCNEHSVINGEKLYLQYKIKEAVLFLTDLAECNNTRSFYILSRIYADGCGDIEKDVDKAIQFRQKGYEAGDVLCAVQFGLFHNSDKEMKQRIIFEYKPKLINMAENGDVFAQYELGICYINETDEPINYNKALEYLCKAANQGFWRAYDSIARRYALGQGVEKDPSIAVEWFLKGANIGYYKSMFELGMCYKKGIGVVKDPEKAVQWLKKASEQISVNEKKCHIENVIAFINNMPKRTMIAGKIMMDGCSMIDEYKEFPTKNAARNYAQNAIAIYVNTLKNCLSTDSSELEFLVKIYFNYLDEIYSQLENLYIRIEGHIPDISEESEMIKQSISREVNNILSYGSYDVYDINESYSRIEVADNCESSTFHKKYRAKFDNFSNPHVEEFRKAKEDFEEKLFIYVKKSLDNIIDMLNKKRNNI